LIPSLNFPRPAATDTTDSQRPAQLRGLAPDEVLVLVDGKRWHTSALVNTDGSIGRGSAPVDLNTIPLSAIDHIEVLRDGASAQYGSDAIAGVINIILKHGAQGGSIELDGGQYERVADDSGWARPISVFRWLATKAGCASAWMMAIRIRRITAARTCVIRSWARSKYLAIRR
jgi:hypothetical protein